MCESSEEAYTCVYTCVHSSITLPSINSKRVQQERTEDTPNGEAALAPDHGQRPAVGSPLQGANRATDGATV